MLGRTFSKMYVASRFYLFCIRLASDISFMRLNWVISHYIIFILLAFSLKDTLAEATALLTEFSAHEQDMEVGKQGDKGEEAAETSRSSSPVFFSTHSPAEHIDDFDTVDRDIS